MKTKILLFSAIFFCAAITTNAQITEGRYLLGGSVSYSNSKDVQSNGSYYEFLYSNIQFGKVIKENTVAGVILSYGFSNNGSSNNANQYSGGVFYRKYKPLTKGLYLFGEVDGVYNYSKNTQGNFKIGGNGNRNTSSGVMISLAPGLSYTVWKKLQIELSMPNLVSLSYSHLKSESTSTDITYITTSKANNFSANANLNTNIANSFGIGFKFLLGK